MTVGELKQALGKDDNKQVKVWALDQDDQWYFTGIYDVHEQLSLIAITLDN